MSYADTYPARIAAKRLKRRRILESRMKAYGSVFNHATVFKKKISFFPMVPKIEHRNLVSAWRRFINYIKSFFI